MEISKSFKVLMFLLTVAYASNSSCSGWLGGSWHFFPTKKEKPVGYWASLSTFKKVAFGVGALAVLGLSTLWIYDYWQKRQHGSDVLSQMRPDKQLDLIKQSIIQGSCQNVSDMSSFFWWLLEDFIERRSDDLRSCLPLQSSDYAISKGICWNDKSLVQKIDLNNKNCDIKIFTDAHGNAHSLLNVIEQLNNDGWLGADNNPFKMTNPENYIAFLGDATDRGKYGMQVWMLLLLLEKHNPGHVIIIKGNHEDLWINHEYGFFDELKSKMGRWPDETDESNLKRFYDHLPSACFLLWENQQSVDKKCILLCHGGPNLFCRPPHFLRFDESYAVLDFSVPFDRSWSEDYLYKKSDPYQWTCLQECLRRGVSYYGGRFVIGREDFVENLKKIECVGIKTVGVIHGHDHSPKKQKLNQFNGVYFELRDDDCQWSTSDGSFQKFGLQTFEEPFSLLIDGFCHRVVGGFCKGESVTIATLHLEPDLQECYLQPQRIEAQEVEVEEEGEV